MNILETNGGYQLQIPERKRDFTVPLQEGIFDMPGQFVSFAPNLHLALNRLAHYYVAFGTQNINIPVHSNAHNQLVLISEFGSFPDESRSPDLEKSEGLAICGFNIRPFVNPETRTWVNNGYTLDIAQFQTSFRDDKDDMYGYLGFIHYHELFTHMIEQLALALKKKGINIEYVSIEKAMTFDLTIALQSTQVMDYSSTPPVQRYDRKKANEERKRIVARRKTFAEKLDYKQTLQVADRIGSNHHSSHAKKIEKIDPDEALQKYLDILLT